MVSAQQLFFFPHKGKYMQTLLEQSGILPLWDWPERERWGGSSGPLSLSVAVPDWFPGLGGGGLLPSPSEVPFPPATCLASPLPLQAFSSAR